MSGGGRWGGGNDTKNKKPEKQDDVCQTRAHVLEGCTDTMPRRRSRNWWTARFSSSYQNKTKQKKQFPGRFVMQREKLNCAMYRKTMTATITLTTGQSLQNLGKKKCNSGMFEAPIRAAMSGCYNVTLVTRRAIHIYLNCTD